VRGIRKSSEGGKFGESPLYACMEKSQWTPFVQLVYINKKENKTHASLKLALVTLSTL
jgi:hypothetical protein